MTKSSQHVFLEKPISVDVETSKRVVEASKKYPHLKTMIGLVRRCKLQLLFG